MRKYIIIFLFLLYFPISLIAQMGSNENPTHLYICKGECVELSVSEELLEEHGCEICYSWRPAETLDDATNPKPMHVQKKLQLITLL
ncbi:MAG: hypothetical protein R3E32_25035 [Chitinophagales bacterium]